MNQALTSAQAAQQHNRNPKGEYQEKTRAEDDSFTAPPVEGDLTGLEPSDVDARISEVWSRIHPVESRISELRKFEQPKFRAVYSKSVIDRKLEEADRLTGEVEEMMAELEPLEDEFTRRGGWTRFFVVEHLHTSRNCSSFRPTTRIGWLPQYSGTSTDDMIAAAGDMVCTKCVPEAPVAGKRPTLPELAAEWDKRNAAADATCSGSGTYYDKGKPHRIGYYSGNWATCPGCGERVTVMKNSGRIRKHKS